MIMELGIDPREILMITFTNKAAKEIQERITSITPKGKRVNKGTFHSVCLNILRKESHLIGLPNKFAIYDTSDQIDVVKAAMKEVECEADAREILKVISSYKNQEKKMSEFKDDVRLDFNHPWFESFDLIYDAYESRMNFYGACDFDDLILKTVNLFRENEDVREKYDKSLKYIVVDEYQDTNSLQVNLLKLLSRDEPNICIVGDDDQGIYGFRGAQITNILDFEEDFPGAVTVKLEKNYRSTQEILNLSNNVISDNKKREDKVLFSDKSGKNVPKVHIYQNPEYEAQGIAEQIVNLIKEGEIPKNIAIICRSSVDFEVIEDQLGIEGIPYKLTGGQKIKDKSEVRDLLSYLRVINNPGDEAALRRAINIPSRGVGGKTIEELSRRAENHGTSLFEAIKIYPHLTPGLGEFIDIIDAVKQKHQTSHIPCLLNDIVRLTDYDTHIQKKSKSVRERNRRLNNVRALIDTAERYTNSNGQFSKLNKFIDIFSINSDEEELEENFVTISTVHGVKGLEFKTVFVPFCNEGKFPHKRMGEDIEEERRLFYVALTRAQENLIVSYSRELIEYGKRKEGHESRFIMKKDDFFERIEKDSWGNVDLGECLFFD